MWASRMSNASILILGLCLFVLVECSNHVSSKDSDHDDMISTNSRLRPRRPHKSHAKHAKEVGGKRGEHDFRPAKRHGKDVPFRDVSAVRAAKVLKGADLEKYQAADKKEFLKVLNKSKKIRSEREKKDDQKPVVEKDKKEDKKKEKSGGCHGYTCHFRDRCGNAPLNPLSVGQRSSNRTKRAAKKKDIDSYMINGTRQKYGEWPSYVRIETGWDYGMSGVCGGALISDRHVLTAAHCMFDPEKGKKKVKVKNIRVILGEDRINYHDYHEMKVRVKDICVSRRYEELVPRAGLESAEDTEGDKSEGDEGDEEKSDEEKSDEEKTNEEKSEGEKPEGEETKKDDSDDKTGAEDEGTAKYDFAVMTLKERLTFTDYHQPSCLPEGEFALLNTDYDKDPQCYLVGSGVTKIFPNGSHTMAKTVEKMRMRRVSCEAYGFGERDESRECYTKAESVGDSCAGDSGGPILCLDDKTKRWSVVSLVSYGTSNCDGAGPIGWVGVYTRVSNLLQIIKNECDL